MSNLTEIAKKAKNASFELASLPAEVKNKALNLIADELEANSGVIFSANKKDLEQAEKLIEQGEISKAVYGRLKLDENKLRDMIEGIHDVKNLPDPVNQKLWAMKLDNGLDLYKVSCPIGVIGVIFEARPDVIAQISSLAIKSGNAVILKGGKESANTNSVIASIIEGAIEKIQGFPKNAVNQIFSRDDVARMLEMDEYIDLIIPRGGNSLVKFIKANTKIPVLGHSDGICHIYVDKSSDFEKAVKIIVDAKTQYPTACNSVETVLIHKEIAKEFLPILAKALEAKDVKIKGCKRTGEILNDIEPADDTDWKTEYSDLILSIKIVDNALEAIKHINKYGSGHTDCIITEDKNAQELFMDLVDSAGVYCNASTRFADGFRYGFGAEVGISTNKTHARGPVGLDGLTIYKYKLYGNGQTVSEYVNGEKTFLHEKITL